MKRRNTKTKKMKKRKRKKSTNSSSTSFRLSLANTEGRPLNMLKEFIEFETVVWAVLVLATTPYILYTVPQLFGADAYIVTSGSMEPNIPEGSVVYEKEVEASQVMEGDVVIFEPNNSQIRGNTVVHRVVDTRVENYTRQFKTKGDANAQADPGWTPSYNIVGKKIFSLPHLGQIIQISNTIPFILTVVGIPTALLLKNQIAILLEAIEQDKQNTS